MSNNQTEKVFTTILMLVGSFSFAMTIAVMSSVIANQDILYMEFRQKMEELSEYMNHRAMPEKLQQKLVNHFDYLFNVQYGKLELEILQQLPSSLRSEMMKLNAPILLNHPFIAGSTDPFILEEMSKILVPRTFSPNEQIVSRKSPIKCIYFIRIGKVDVLSPTDDKSTITSLLEGDHFGAYEFFFGRPSSYTHNTATFTEMLLVHRADFEAMMSDPRFDREARIVDFTTMYITTKLGSFEEVKEKTSPEETTDEGEEEDMYLLAPKDFVEGLEKWSAQQQILDASGLDTLERNPDGTPKTMPATIRQRKNRSSRDSFGSSRSTSPGPFFGEIGRVLEREDSVMSSSDFDEEQSSAKHRGLVNCFLEYRSVGIDLRKKVKQLKKNMGKKKKFQDMMNEEEEEMLGSASKGIILANSRFRKLWDVLCFIGTLWYSIAIPFRLYLVTWENDTPFTDKFGFAMPIDWIFDFFFVTNIALNARYFATTEINEKGKVTNIVDRVAIWDEYALSGRMLTDVLISIPYDFVGFSFGSWNALRIPKLLTAFRLPYLITRLKRHLETQSILVRYFFREVATLRRGLL